MFGKRQSFGGNTPGAAEPPRPQASPPPASGGSAAVPAVPARAEVAKPVVDAAINRLRNDEIVDVRSAEAIARDKEYFQTKSAIFHALLDSLALSQLATMEQEAAREEIRDIVAEIIALKTIVKSNSEQEDLLEEICNDDHRNGPLEPLLA